MGRSSKVRHCITVLLVIVSTAVYAQETPDSPELAACRARVGELADQVVAIRLEALRKTEEAKAYEAARAQRDALKPQAKQ